MNNVFEEIRNSIKCLKEISNCCFIKFKFIPYILFIFILFNSWHSQLIVHWNFKLKIRVIIWVMEMKNQYFHCSQYIYSHYNDIEVGKRTCESCWFKLYNFIDNNATFLLLLLSYSVLTHCHCKKLDNIKTRSKPRDRVDKNGLDAEIKALSF